MSKELQDEIEFIFASNNQDNYLAYRTKIVTLHRNDDKICYFASYNKCIRLYNRKYSDFGGNNNIIAQRQIYRKNITLSLFVNKL